jgi:nitroreductase
MDGNGTIEKAIRRPQALESLLSRRSVGQLCEPAPEGDDFAHIIEAGLQAPDHGRLRPWRFVTIRGAARTTLAEMGGPEGSEAFLLTSTMYGQPGSILEIRCCN